jgi:hypothetical protein
VGQASRFREPIGAETALHQCDGGGEIGAVPRRDVEGTNAASGCEDRPDFLAVEKEGNTLPLVPAGR